MLHFFATVFTAMVGLLYLYMLFMKIIYKKTAQKILGKIPAPESCPINETFSHYYISNAGMYVGRYTCPTSFTLCAHTLSISSLIDLVLAVALFYNGYNLLGIIALIEATVILFSNTVRFFSFANLTEGEFLERTLTNYRLNYPQDKLLQQFYDPLANQYSINTILYYNILADEITEEYFRLE
ncbi:hypothetical protein LJC10_02105 [Selenomonadales bacterium OttesenSCG-928-I06]|nr:hypothetical protein [Selenomonadales bacterium OttesenSCG-928-I06]